MSGQQGGEWCQEAKGRWRQPGQGTVPFPKSGTKVFLRSVCMWPLFLPFPSILCQTWAPSSGRWLEPTLLREKHPRVIAIPQFINLLKTHTQSYCRGQQCTRPKRTGPGRLNSTSTVCVSRELGVCCLESLFRMLLRGEMRSGWRGD